MHQRSCYSLNSWSSYSSVFLLYTFIVFIVFIVFFIAYFLWNLFCLMQWEDNLSNLVQQIYRIVPRLYLCKQYWYLCSIWFGDSIFETFLLAASGVKSWLYQMLVYLTMILMILVVLIWLLFFHYSLILVSASSLFWTLSSSFSHVEISMAILLVQQHWPYPSWLCLS